MMSLVIGSYSYIDRMMQLTGQNQFTRSLSGGYKMMNGSRVHNLFFMNGRRSNKKSVVRGREY